MNKRQQQKICGRSKLKHFLSSLSCWLVGLLAFRGCANKEAYECFFGFNGWLLGRLLNWIVPLEKCFKLEKYLRRCSIDIKLTFQFSFFCPDDFNTEIYILLYTTNSNLFFKCQFPLKSFTKKGMNLIRS